jgi:membrane associated rhomboid family serine protease
MEVQGVGFGSWRVSGLTLLLWANTLAFLLEIALQGGVTTGGGLFGIGGVEADVLWSAGADGPRAVFSEGEWWRLFSAVFLHANVIHIFFNCWVLWQLGRIAEPLFGTHRFLLAYLACGLCSSLASDVWQRLDGDRMISIGASGAVFGILGLLLGHVRRRKDAAARHFGRILLQNAVLLLVVGFLWPQVNQAAHIGGLVTGFAIGTFLGSAHFDHLRSGIRRLWPRLARGGLAAAAAAALVIAGLGASGRYAPLQSYDLLMADVLVIDERLRLDLPDQTVGAWIPDVEQTEVVPELAPFQARFIEILRRNAREPVPAPHVLGAVGHLARELFTWRDAYAPDLKRQWGFVEQPR